MNERPISPLRPCRVVHCPLIDEPPVARRVGEQYPPRAAALSGGVVNHASCLGKASGSGRSSAKRLTATWGQLSRGVRRIGNLPIKGSPF